MQTEPEGLTALLREYMTRAEVADFLRVTPRTVYNMEKRGELKSYRVGPRHLVYRRADILALVGAGQ